MDASRSELSSALEQLDLAACLSMGFAEALKGVGRLEMLKRRELLTPPEVEEVAHKPPLVYLCYNPFNCLFYIIRIGGQVQTDKSFIRFAKPFAVIHCQPALFLDKLQ